MQGDPWTAVIIEDDPDVRDLIDVVLTQSGFTTVVAENGAAGVEAVRTHDPLITTLDVNMPGMDGFAAARRLREFSNTYLIMITALADEIDVVQGFQAGADDYLVKPFRPRELRARADSMLRRPRARTEHPVGWADDAAPSTPPAPAGESWAVAATRALTSGSSGGSSGGSSSQVPGRARPAPRHAEAAPAPVAQQQPQQPYAAPEPPRASYPQPEPVPAPVPHAPAPGPAADGAWVRFNGLALNTESRAVSVAGVPIDLSQPEFDLLASLLSTGRRVRSKADLVLTMRGQQYVTSYFVNEADKRSVEVHIASLRRKLGDDGQVARFVETVRGVGYRLAEPV